MIKSILAAVGGLVVAVLLATFFFWRAASDPYDLVASGAPRVIADAIVAADSTPSAAPADSAAIQDSPSSPVPPADITGVAVTAAGGAPASSNPSLSEAEKDAITQEVRDIQARFGRVFASMNADDAIEIFSHLPDEAVRGVLSQLPARSTADLLSRLPAERAARIAGPLLPTMTLPSR